MLSSRLLGEKLGATALAFAVPNRVRAGGTARYRKAYTRPRFAASAPSSSL